MKTTWTIKFDTGEYLHGPIKFFDDGFIWSYELRDCLKDSYRFTTSKAAHRAAKTWESFSPRVMRVRSKS